MADNKRVLRIIDVNLNRAKEGLRCCEEVARFILDDSALTKALKFLRHNIEEVAASSGIKKSSLCAARDVKTDCGKSPCVLEKKDDWQGIFLANIQRVKEALRALEEFFKLIDDTSCERFKALRFEVYEQEKIFVGRHLK